MILRSRIVLPVSQPPIEDGAVAISGRRIAWVGRWAELPSSLAGEVRDLGEAIILPGLINVKNSAPARESAHKAVSEWAALPEASENACSANRVGLSPHAPYTTTRELLQFAAGAARRHRWRLTTHVAESEEEFDMFVHRRGPLHDWLQNQRDMADCGEITPVQHLERSGYLSENLLAVHANYLGQGDAR